MPDPVKSFFPTAFFSTHERKWNLCVRYSLVFCEKILIVTLANGPQVTIEHALTKHGKDVTKCLKPKAV